MMQACMDYQSSSDRWGPADSQSWLRSLWEEVRWQTALARRNKLTEGRDLIGLVGF